MKQHDAMIGFSVNPELVVLYDPEFTGAKISAKDFQCVLSGTSGNVAKAMKNLGAEPLLLAGIGEDEQEPVLALLKTLLQQAQVDYRSIPIRRRTSVASLHLSVADSTDKRVVGYKPPLDLKLFPQATKQIRRIVKEAKGQWRIATGVMPGELALVRALFANSSGQRILNPRQELMADHDAAWEILQKTDFLVCNDIEFASLFGSYHPDPLKRWYVNRLAKIHDKGVTLVAVTMNSRGALVSLNGDLYSFSPQNFGACVDEVGAGDWWLGAFVTRMIHLGFSTTVLDLTQAEVTVCGAFATAVAGFKVTMPGSSNGPTLAQVEKDMSY